MSLCFIFLSWLIMYSEINGKSNLGENLTQGVDISTIHSNFRATSFNVFCHLLNSQSCIEDLLCQLQLCLIYKMIKSERQYDHEYLLDFWLLLHLMTLLPLKQQRQLHSWISTYSKPCNNSCNNLKCGGSSDHFLVLVLYFLCMF